MIFMIRILLLELRPDEKLIYVGQLVVTIAKFDATIVKLESLCNALGTAVTFPVSTQTYGAISSDPQWP